jgi:hypothetical protein
VPFTNSHQTQAKPLVIELSSPHKVDELFNVTSVCARSSNELLHVVLRKLIPAFDLNKVRIEWPQYGNYDSVLLYASAIEQTMLLAAKR